MKNTYHIALCAIFSGLLLLLTACGPTAHQIQPQPTSTINKSFQAKVSPVPTPATYRCGAWASNNAPNAFSTISIYAKLTRDVNGVGGATAVAVVHFPNNDVTLDQIATSDSGGYVTFTLTLLGRQPRQVPTTVDVTFTVAGTRVVCTPAFFTPL